MSGERNSVTIEATAVTKYFGSRHQRFTAVDDVSITVNSASAIGIVGESGSGKSTLSRMLVGLDSASAGSVLLNGREISDIGRTVAGMRELRRTVQFVAQDSMSSFDPRKTLRQALRRPAQVLLGCDAKYANELVDELLQSLALSPQMADRFPEEVSGGQRQRFSLARALIVRPRILVCDEVVSALDVSVQGQILNFLKDYCIEHGSGLVFVSHGLPATAFISDEMVVMHSGRIIERAAPEKLTTAPEHPYTIRLMGAARPATGG